MNLRASNCDTDMLRPPPWTDQDHTKWRLQLLLDRHHTEMQAMRAAQNYDFERAMDCVQSILPGTHCLDIFVQAMLATSTMHLGLLDVQAAY